MNRLALLRKSKNMSQTELGKKFGAAQNTVSQWERGTREPDYEMLQALAEFFGASTDYLLGRTDYSDIPAPTTKGKWIPVLGNVQAGIPIEAIEDIIGYEEISNEMAQSGDYFALRIRGDSQVGQFAKGANSWIRCFPIFNVRYNGLGNSSLFGQLRLSQPSFSACYSQLHISHLDYFYFDNSLI